MKYYSFIIFCLVLIQGGLDRVVASNTSIDDENIQPQRHSAQTMINLSLSIEMSQLSIKNVDHEMVAVSDKPVDASIIYERTSAPKIDVTWQCNYNRYCMRHELGTTFGLI